MAARIKVDSAVIGEIQRLLAQPPKGEGLTYRQAADRTGLSLPTIYKYAPVTKPVHTLSVPSLNGERSRALVLTPDQFVSLGGPEAGSMLSREMVVGDIQAQASAKAEASLKQRILIAVAKEGPVPNVLSLCQIIREGPRDFSFDPHNVVHLLWSLNKGGLVKFRENKRNSPNNSNAELENIECTRRGFEAAGYGHRIREVGRRGGKHRAEQAQRQGDKTDFRVHSDRAEGGDIIREALIPTHMDNFPLHVHDMEDLPTATVTQQIVAGRAMTEHRMNVQRRWDARHNARLERTRHPRPELPLPRANEEPFAVPASPRAQQPVLWPILEQLRARQDALAAAEDRAEAYTQAAIALEAVDPEQSALLLSKAESATQGLALSATETEYMEAMWWLRGVIDEALPFLETAAARSDVERTPKQIYDSLDRVPRRQLR